MLLVIDNYDSFTYNLVQYLGELGADVLVRRNDAVSVEEVGELAPEGIVLSPGPCAPAQAGVTVDVIRAWGESTPILGVDGSLADVVPPDDPARGHVHAKTGTLAAQREDGTIVLQTKALAGYIDTPKGKRLVFALYINDLPIHEVFDVLEVNKTLGHIAPLISNYHRHPPPCLVATCGGTLPPRKR